jgi:predicted Zn finger-like uncharacterized protein
MTFDDTIADQSQATQCPHCNTAFLVSDEQLTIANGQVRCGSCLGIFQADQYWLTAEGETASSSTFADTNFADTNGTFSPPPKGMTHTTSALDADSLAALAHNNAAPDNDRSSDFELSDSFLELTESEAAQAPFEEYTAGDSAVPVDEEQWARELLEEEEPQDKTPRNELLCAILDQPAGNRQTQEMTASEPTAAGGVDADERAPAQLDSAEKWMQQVLGQEPSPEQTEPPVETLAPITAPDDPADPWREEPAEEPAEEYVPEIFRKSGQSAVAPLLPQPIAAKPLHIRISERTRQATNTLRNWLVRMATMVAIGVALVILTLQLIWFNAEHLSGQSLLHPAIAQFCQFSGCSLAVERVSSQVRQSAPTAYRLSGANDTIILEAVLTNEADAPRPYPNLQVEFIDQQGRALASRTFRPLEYLPNPQLPAEGIANTNHADNDLSDTGQRPMPAGQSAPILLQLIDPDPAAVRYRIRLIDGALLTGSPARRT